jgi:hypothetical protein
MESKIKQFISKQALTRQNLLTKIHEIIVDTDKTVEPIVEPMMGHEMIVYKARGMMKYALASVKKYMSLHVLPIYSSKPLFEKYQILLNKAKFQKGCVNFDNEEEMPLDIVKQLMKDCSKIDLVKIREEYLKSKKSKHKD